MRRSRSRVKVKAPKSGSERLELVLDTTANNPWGGNQQYQHQHQVDDTRGDHAATNYYGDDGYDREQPYQYYDEQQQQQQQQQAEYEYAQSIYPVPSTSSMSTTETDNRASARSGSLSKTWSMTSDEHGNVRYEAQEQQYALGSLPEDDDDDHGEDDYERFVMQPPPPPSPRPDSVAAAYESFDSEVDVTVPKYGYDDDNGDDDDDEQYYETAAPQQQHKTVSFDGSNDSDADLASFATEPGEPAQPTESHADLAGLKQPYRKSVSFDDGADRGEADHGEADDEVGEIKELAKLRIAPSEDTSAESMGWKVMTTWSKENKPPSSPKKAPKPLSPLSSPLAQQPSPQKSVLRVQPKYSFRRSKNKNRGNDENPAMSSRNAVNEDTDKIIQDLNDTSDDSPEDSSPENSPLNQSSSSYSSDSTATSVVTEPAIAFNINGGYNKNERCSVVTEPPFNAAAGNNSSPARQTTNVLQQRPVANANARKKALHPPYVRTNHGAQSVVSQLSTSGVSAYFNGPSFVSENENSNDAVKSGYRPNSVISEDSDVAVKSGIRPSPTAKNKRQQRVQQQKRAQQLEQMHQQQQQYNHEHIPQQQAQAQQQQTSKLHHRRTLPRDHPDHPSNANAAANDDFAGRPAIQRSDSNVSNATSAYSEAALDGYVEPKSASTGSSKSRRGKAAAGLMKKAKKIKNVKNFLRRKKSNSGKDEKKSSELPKEENGMGDIPTTVDRSRRSSPPPPPSSPFTQYEFEGYDNLKSPRGGQPSPDLDNLLNHANPWAAAGSPSSVRGRGNKGGGNNIDTTPANDNPWATTTAATNNDANNATPTITTNNNNNNNHQQSANPFLTSPITSPANNKNTPLSPPAGSLNLQGTGMPSVKWWSWRQSEDGENNNGTTQNDNKKAEENEQEDCTYFAFMCMFPPAGAKL